MSIVRKKFFGDRGNKYNTRESKLNLNQDKIEKEKILMQYANSDKMGKLIVIFTFFDNF